MRPNASTSLAFLVLPHYDTVRPDPDEPWVQQIARKYGKTPNEVADFAEETANAIFLGTGEQVVWSTLIDAIHDGFEAVAKAKRERDYAMAKKNAAKKDAKHRAKR